MVTGTADNGGWWRDMMLAGLILAYLWDFLSRSAEVRGKIIIFRLWETYGKQLGEHRHRRNRPCTFPIYVQS